MLKVQMRSRSAMLLAAASGLLLIGCSRPGPLEPWPEAERRLQHGVRETARGSTAHESAGSQAARLPTESATVEDYVRLALARNPDLQRARHEAEAALAEVPQVTSLDDPMFMVSPVGEMAQTAAGEVAVMTSISQRLPFPGKLKARGEAALAEARAARAELTAARLRIVTEVRHAYWAYYDVIRATGVIERSRELLEQYEQAAQAAYAAGRVPQQDVLRAQVELDELERSLLTLQQRGEAQAARLNALMDRSVEAALPAPADVRIRPVDASLANLLERAERSNPELARVRQQVEAARQRLEAARLQRWPDVTAGVSYNLVENEGLVRSPTGDDQWWLSLGINLPIWTGKYDAAEREERHRMLGRLASLAQRRNTLAAELRELVAEVQTQQRLVDLFGDELIPKTRQALEASLAAYRAGDAEFANIIDHWQNLLRYRQLYHTAVADLASAFADMEQVVGEELPTKPVVPAPAMDAEPPDQPAPESAEME